MSDISYRIEKYEGPLDLLLALVQKNKMDIYDIPIVELTEQFLAYVQQLEENNLDVSSEFLVMASQLLLIKSRMLLPKQKEEEQEDPREELVNQLLEYQKFKGVAEILSERQHFGEFVWEREPDYIEPAVHDFTFSKLNVYELYKALQEVLERKNFIDKKPTTGDFVKITQKNRVSVISKVHRLLAELEEMNQISLFVFFDEMKNKDEIIASFLAVLELLKLNKININQGKIEKRN